MNCINSHCRKKIDDIELRNNFNWKRFCIKCRKNNDKITKIDCISCGIEMSFNLSKANVSVVFCRLCSKIRRQRKKVEYYQTKYKFQNTNQKKILKLLGDGGMVSSDECLRVLNTSKKGLQRIIFNLNKNGNKINKLTTEYYYIKQTLINN